MALGKFDSHGNEVHVEVFRPTAVMLGGIVVAYGTRGMNAPFGEAIQAFAGHLAEAGYAALVPYYFERTGTTPSEDFKGDSVVLEAFSRHKDAWMETLSDCLDYFIGAGDIRDDRIGLLGFSMGGNLVLRRAKLESAVTIDAVIEFFAPVTWPSFFNLGDVGKLPPTQIHYGLDDEIVHPQQSLDLEALLVGAGKKKGLDYEIWDYPGEGHGFQGEAAINESTQRTIDFFRKHVK